MRRTKEDAARTRDSIIEAALACFDRHGIAGTTLDQIAAEAGVTKGAIYWHFKGKQEIFRAIREEISLPVLDRADTTLLHEAEGPALGRIEAFLLGILDTLEGDRRRARALGIMNFKCEYVGSLEAELEAVRRNHQRLTLAFEAAYVEAQKRRELDASLDPSVAAASTLMILNGMARLWLLDTGRGGIRRAARDAIMSHIRLQSAR